MQVEAVAAPPPPGTRVGAESFYLSVDAAIDQISPCVGVQPLGALVQ
jgi:hypothetical protein